MIRFNPRRPIRRRISTAILGLAASGVVAVTALTGCGAGQNAQTSIQEPGVNGAAGQVKQVALRNIYIQAVQTGDFLKPGQSVELILVATNQSQEAADKLTRITSDVGAVTLTGEATLPASGALFVGNPAGDDIKAVDVAEAADAAKATVVLSKPISNGLTYPFTFDFQNAGSVTISVPIAVGEAAPAAHR